MTRSTKSFYKLLLLFTSHAQDHATLDARISSLCETALIYTRGDTMQLRFELNQELYSKLVWGQKLSAFIKAAREAFPLLDRLCAREYDEALQQEVSEQG